MAHDPVRVEFMDGFKGTLIAPKGQTKIGSQENGLRPYNLLFGALASCFYATFLDIVEKKKLTFEKAVVEVNGQARKEIPTTLEICQVKLIVYKPSNEEQFNRSALLGAKYCSIYETISKVAKMELVVEFVY